MNLIENHLVRVMPNAGARTKRAFPFLRDAMKFSNIDTSPRIAAFIGQVAFESAELLGRPESTDGGIYQPRGWLPIEGMDNYRRLQVFFGFELMRRPEIVNDHRWAPFAAAYIWNREGGNRLADQWDLEGIIQRFSFKLQPDNEPGRLEYFLKAAKALGAEKGVPHI